MTWRTLPIILLQRRLPLTLLPRPVTLVTLLPTLATPSLVGIPQHLRVIPQHLLVTLLRHLEDIPVILGGIRLRGVTPDTLGVVIREVGIQVTRHNSLLRLKTEIKGIRY